MRKFLPGRAAAARGSWQSNTLSAVALPESRGGTSHPQSHEGPNLTSKPSSSQSAGAHRLCSDSGKGRCLQALQSCLSSPCPSGLLRQGLFTLLGENQPQFRCWQTFLVASDAAEGPTGTAQLQGWKKAGDRETVCPPSWAWGRTAVTASSSQSLRNHREYTTNPFMTKQSAGKENAHEN